jgi:predicted transcriptional regulator of viral defense system
MYMAVKLEDRALIALHRATHLAGRPGVVVNSSDLDAVDEITGSRVASKQALGRLTRVGAVVPVRRNLAVLPDSTGLIDVDLLDLIDAAAGSSQYLVTGGRALELHRLSDQHFFQVAVIAPKRIAAIEWRGESARFFVVSAKRIWGSTALPGRSRRASVAGAERAILDSVSHPRYGASLEQAVGALRVLLRRKKLGPLLRATKRYKTAAVARRKGFLIEQLLGVNAAAPFLELTGASRTPVPLRVGRPADGPIDRRWRVNVNVDIDLLLEGE